MPTRILLSTAFGPLAIVTAGYLAAGAQAQDVASQTNELVCTLDDSRSAPLAMGRSVLGPGSCRGCHLVGTGASVQLDPSLIDFVGEEYFRRMQHDKWVLGNEWQTWAVADRHVQAYITLLGERSRRMGEILGVKEIHRDARCLACHASIPVHALDLEDGLVPAEFFAESGVDERLGLGVNCEACHGASGTNTEDGLEGWYGPHVASLSWRYRSAGSKEEFGFYDIRSPASRARMCLSCHLGSMEDGRFVTHEMYAAGHPPLPGFEVESFMRMMPPHWRVLGTPSAEELENANVKPASLTRTFLDETEHAFYKALRNEQPERFAEIRDDYSTFLQRTRSLVVGAIVAFSENLKFTAALASEADYPLYAAEHRWPDFSQFECYACHHDLKVGGWRQRRDPPSLPGALPLKAWPSAIVWAVCQAEGEDATSNLRKYEDFINKATARQPFGDRGALVQELRAAATWSDELAGSLESRALGVADGRRLLREICRVGSAHVLDYDSARQLLWAFEEILHDLDQQAAWTKSRDKLAQMKEHFVLDLATKDVRAENTLDIPGFGQRKALEIDLSQVLPPIADYDALELRDEFAALAKTISE